jgi:hypothetical protein
MVKYDVTPEEQALIYLIADRALKCAHRDRLAMQMYITACHCNGCPLDLDGLLNASDKDFLHDVFFVIDRSLDRATGKLSCETTPRFARVAK